MRFHKRINEGDSPGENDQFCLFELEAPFPGRSLLVNISKSIISLLPGESDQCEHVIAQHILTEAEMRMLLPLLENPNCCQQAILQASYCCTYEFLLQSLLFSDDANTNPQWNELVQQQRERLQRAQQKKAQRKEMRAVYNAIFGLRPKLEQLGLTIRVRRDGYYLGLLVEGEQKSF